MAQLPSRELLQHIASLLNLGRGNVNYTRELEDGRVLRIIVEPKKPEAKVAEPKKPEAKVSEPAPDDLPPLEPIPSEEPASAGLPTSSVAPLPWRCNDIPAMHHARRGPAEYSLPTGPPLGHVHASRNPTFHHILEHVGVIRRFFPFPFQPETETKRPLPPAVFQRLPVEEVFDLERYLNAECCVCQTGYCRGERVITLPCMHRYHESCIRTWFERASDCPLCKRVVE